jgi:V-type H+-transporting ATPase subunit H
MSYNSLTLTPFRLEGDYITNTLNNIRTRPVSWTAFVKANYLNENNSETLKTLTNMNNQDDPKTRGNAIGQHTDIYSKVLVSSIESLVNNNNNSNDYDLIKIILTIIYDGIGYIKTDDFTKTLTYEIFQLNNTTAYDPFVKLLNSNKNLNNDDNIIISILSAYIITSFLTTTTTLHIDNSTNDKTNLILDYVQKNLITSNDTQFQFIGLQILKEILSIKKFRNLYIKQNLNDSNIELLSLTKILLNKSIELQMKYLTIYCLWTLTFDLKITSLIINDSKFSEIIPCLFNYANDAVKEKVVRLSISILINILNNSSNNLLVIKKYLLSNGLTIIKNLIDRKWSDNDLKEDLNNIFEILNDSIKSLTTFDEYENEVRTKHLIWSPCHKNQEFWFDNIDKFKENNWKLVKSIINLLNDDSVSDNQLYLNQSIICYDLSMLIKVSPEIIKVISNLGTKTKIMTLMNSPNANVKFEALRTTQLLVANIF